MLFRSQDVNQALEVINTEISKIQKGDLARSDLAATKDHLVGGILLGSESTDGRMMRLAKNEYVFNRHVTYEELVSNLEKVTLEELVAVAEDAFQCDSVSLVTLGPIRKDDLDLSCLRFGTT